MRIRGSRDEEQLNNWMLKLEGGGLAALDTETTSIDPFQARLGRLSFSVEHACALTLPVAHLLTGAPEQLSLERGWRGLKPWLEDPRRRQGRPEHQVTTCTCSRTTASRSRGCSRHAAAILSWRPQVARHGQSGGSASLVEDAHVRRGDGKGANRHPFEQVRRRARHRIRSRRRRT